MVKWTIEQFLPQPQMHSYLLKIVVHGFQQVEKHVAVKALTSLVGFKDE